MDLRLSLNGTTEVKGILQEHFLQAPSQYISPSLILGKAIVGI
jgi:hypothetical protein